LVLERLAGCWHVRLGILGCSGPRRMIVLARHHAVGREGQAREGRPKTGDGKAATRRQGQRPRE
jgi:hypothetical protein